MKRIVLTVSAVLLLTILPLSAVPLEDLLQGAKENSAILQMYQLSKESTDLSLTDIEKTTSVSVSPSLTFADMSILGLTAGPETVLTGTADITIGLPTEETTTVTITPGQIIYSLESYAFQASPSLSVSRSFSIQDNGDTLQDLRDARSILQNETLYRTNVSNFTISVYTSISEILTHEKNIVSLEQDIADLEKTMSNTLALGRYGKDSTLYKGYELQLSALRRSLISSEKQLALAQVQYRQLTGLAYQEVDEIPFPSLSFSPLSGGNSDLVLSELDVEIAREQAALFKRQSVASSAGWSVPSFVLSGSAGLDYVNTGTATADYDLSAAGSYTSGGFSTNASVGLDISNTGNLTPSVTIGGSWSTQNSESRSIQERLYANELATAELTYAQDFLSYQIDAQNLSNSILSWQNETEEFALTLEYHESQVLSVQEGLSLGLNTEQEVAEVEHVLALDDYEQKILALKGLVLGEQIAQMQY
ncbi:MAG: TolC family protein [Sphaerochaetaceae bacterium]|nr:TolC family protein [Sphaerochaetaceae bacterium]